MRTDITEIGRIGELPDDEFDLFRSSVQMLLSRTFILRGIEKEERLYDFTIRNITLIDAWFACADAVIKRDESLGVIAWRGGHETRARLGREETCALLVLRLLYEEKRTEITLTRFPSVTVFDFMQKYRAIVEADLKKTRLVDILRRLSAHKLIGIPSDLAGPDSILALYPSLALTLDRDAIDEILASIRKETT